MVNRELKEDLKKKKKKYIKQLKLDIEKEKNNDVIKKIQLNIKNKNIVENLTSLMCRPEQSLNQFQKNINDNKKMKIN